MFKLVGRAVGGKSENKGINELIAQSQNHHFPEGSPQTRHKQPPPIRNESLQKFMETGVMDLDFSLDQDISTPSKKSKKSSKKHNAKQASIPIANEVYNEVSFNREFWSDMVEAQMQDLGVKYNYDFFEECLVYMLTNAILFKLIICVG